VHVKTKLFPYRYQSMTRFCLWPDLWRDLNFVHTFARYLLNENHIVYEYQKIKDKNGEKKSHCIIPNEGQFD
jgi:hypothetical protein